MGVGAESSSKIVWPEIKTVAGDFRDPFPVEFPYCRFDQPSSAA
jgi:hypothetical protein